MEKLKSLKERLMHCVETQIYGNLEQVDAKELGEVVDMIKDISEAMYYCSIVEAMEEAEEEKEKMEGTEKYYPPVHYPKYYPPVTYYPEQYRDMDRDMGRMYYDGGRTTYAQSGGQGSGGNRGYQEYPMEMRDVREGRSPMSRKNYMEAKEMHHDKAVQMKELEAYLKELSHDVTEMVADATPEEKTMLQQKLTMLANKIK